MLPVLLDESCDRLEPLLRGNAETAIFRRSGGYLGDPEICARELESFRQSRFAARRVVLVAGSFGALTALLHANCHPETVGGMMLVDPSHRQQSERAVALLVAAGVGDSAAAEGFRRYTEDRAPAWWRAGGKSAAAIRPMGDLPLIVLAAGSPEVDGELPAELYGRLVADRHMQLQEYASLSTCGVLRVVDRSGHGIVVERPEVVVQAVYEVNRDATRREA